MADEKARDWLVLIHQLPAEPASLRLRILRRLKAVGAVALKNSVYLLPDTPDTREDLHWIRREVIDGGGDATLSVARFLEGVPRGQLEALFREERDREYAEIAQAVKEDPDRTGVGKLRRRLDAVIARDHFDAAGRAAAEHALRMLEQDQSGGGVHVGGDVQEKPDGATWVTRRGAFIDRLASAWLIRRFIDPGARFRFVDPDAYEHAEGELRFDMFEGEYTHEGERCTFETLVARFGLRDVGLMPLSEIVHDIDCKDDRFGRPEAPGIATVVRGIGAEHERDEDRLASASHLFDGLFARFTAAPD
ncbi:MAG: chromate resistance protein ChrB domain-containing protein [Gemmatimonadota bacterium]